MMYANGLSEKVRSIILTNFSLARTRNVTDNDGLLESSIIDSLGVLELVAHLEKEFNIVVADEDLIPDNFQTIECLAAFVQTKRNATSGQTL